MNIAYLISSLSFGGAEKQTVLDANLLYSNSVVFKINKVYVLSFRAGPLKSFLLPGITYEVLKKDSYFRTAIRLVAYIRKHRIKVVHVSLFAPMTISALASIFTEIKVIWHFHSHEFGIPLKSQLAFRYLAKLPSIKKILFVNHELLNYFSFNSYPKKKLGVLYNHSVIDTPLLKSEVSQKLVNIGYLGRVIELKRVNYLVDLAEYLIRQEGFTDIKIHIVGDGNAMEEIKTLVSNSRNGNYFIFHGFQEEVTEYYLKFDLFVNPSSEECLSIAMIDAGIMGLPIVAFDVGGNNEIVINEKTGYIVKDKQEFFARCFQLIRKPDQRKKLGINAQIHCSNTFSAKKHLKEIKKIYTEIFDDS